MTKPSFNIPLRVSFDISTTKAWKLLNKDLGLLNLSHENAHNSFREMIKSIPSSTFSLPPEPQLVAAVRHNRFIKRSFRKIYLALRLEWALVEEANLPADEILDRICDWFGEVLDCAEFNMLSYPDSKELWEIAKRKKALPKKDLQK